MMMTALRLTVIALGFSIGVAAAQTPVDPNVLSKLVHEVTRAAKANNSGALSRGGISGGGATLNAIGNVATGWNYFHATYCEWYTDGTNNFTFIFPQEGGFWFTENNLYTSQTFNTGCVNGNWEAVNVINSSTGAFNANLTYPFK